MYKSEKDLITTMHDLAWEHHKIRELASQGHSPLDITMIMALDYNTHYTLQAITDIINEGR
jgi:hypothetical protein